MIPARRLISSSPRSLEPLPLVQACLEGSRGAWDEFARRYRGHIGTVARQTLRKIGVHGAESVAEDVTSEVFAELLANDGRALSKFRAPFSLKAWLAVVTRRKAYRVAERSRRHVRDTLDEPERISRGGPSPASDVARIEQRTRVQRHLDELAPRDRLALQLFYEGGHSYKEVARTLDIPAQHVGTLLARARKRLAKSLGIRTS